MLSEKEFQELAALARLDPEDPGLAGLRDDFNKILDYVNQINEVDTSAIDDAYSRDETRNVLRKDDAGETLEPRVIGEFAPRWEAGHFVVPGVIDSES